MRILLVGGGGREHALAWALARSPHVDELVAAPGNAGIEEVARCVPVPADDVPALVDLAEREAVDLTVVGPEGPLVGGLVDALEERGRPAFGPRRDAARLEGSKVWAKELCAAHGIPTARSEVFTGADEAARALDRFEPPHVIKADGLAAGKGVAVAATREEAERAIRACLVDRVFGEAGDRVLVEEHLAGREVSVLALTDGSTVVPLVPAQDHKRALDGDRGANTGGMGAYSPVPFVDAGMEDRIREEVLEPAVAALRAAGVRYRGVLYAGLMLTDDGPRVLEFNCRFGDPEAQAVIPRMASDLAEALLACAEGTLAQHEVRWTPDAAVTVVAASGGYPGPYRTGHPVEGLEEARKSDKVLVFHAGTARRGGRVVTAGGRVLAVTALGRDVAAARERAYAACSRISFQGMHVRTDIARGAEG